MNTKKGILRLLVVPCLVLIPWVPVLALDEGTSSPTGKFIESWLLVRLATPIGDKTPDGSFALDTGFTLVDAMIREAGVYKIDSALPVSARNPRQPELFRKHGLDRTYRFHLPEGADVLMLADRFAQLPGVDYAEPDYIGEFGAVIPDDPLFPDQWNFDQPSDADVDGPEGWEVARGDGVVIAVIDTGVDSDHPDLDGKFVPGYDFFNDDADPEDDYGHGTKVASVTSAETNNAEGIAGTCWNCRIMPLKAGDADGNTSHSLVTDAAVWATDNGAQVINLSAGWTLGSQTLHSGVQYAYDAGVIYVSITANQDINYVKYPARYPETIAVGATDDLDRRVAPFSCSGSGGSNYGNEIDVVAPGDLIRSAVMGGGYDWVCGTSFAAPHVAGLVGVMETIYPSVGREEARHQLHSGADDQVGRPTEDAPRFDIYHGWGRINIERTLLGTESSMSLRVDGKSLTRVFFSSANPLASSYDFIRGDLNALSESADGVNLGSVICLENDSPDPDTAGNEDTGTPAPGAGFFYLGRFNAPPGAGSYGGSSRNRDRTPAAADCPG